MTEANKNPTYSNYLNDRQKLSKDIEANFSQPYYGVQVSTAIMLSSKIFNGLSSEAKEFICKHVVEYPKLGDLFKMPEDLSDTEYRNFLDGFSRLPAEQYERFLQVLNLKLDAQMSESSADQQKTPFSEEIMSYVEKLKAARAKHSQLDKNFGEDQAVFNEMHATKSQRHQDGNSFLMDHYSDFFKEGANLAGFIGGSIGITCLDFQSSLGERASNWEIINLDLFRPDDIYQNFYKKPKESFPMPEAIQYLQADMTQLPFGPSQFDFLDVSNSTGYVTNLSKRFAAVQNIWRSLKVGGICRLVTPSFESLFDQVIFKKIDEDPWHAELLFVSQTGKSEIAEDGAVRYQNAQALSKIVVPLWQELHRKKSAYDRSKLGASTEQRIHGDLAFMNPVFFMAGIWDDMRIHALQNNGFKEMKSQVRAYFLPNT